jgi:tRNA dimethylallyltransferase
MQMVEEGLFDEVQRLLDSGLSPACTAMQAIGYKEAVLALRGEITRDEAAALIQQGSRRYAKRQITWFGRWQDACRILWDGVPDFAEALRSSTAFLRSRGYAV